LWFDQLLTELGIELAVGPAAEIAARRVKKQKNDPLDSDLIWKLLERGEFPAIYWPSAQVRDHRALLSHRHRLVRLRTRVKNSLQAIALSHRKALGPRLFTRQGLTQLTALSLPAYRARQRQDGLALLDQLNTWVDELDREIEKLVDQYPAARRLMTHPGVGPITALAVVLILGPVDRFTNPSQVASYFGLVPSEHSSAGHQRFGGLTKQGSCLGRYLLVPSGHRASQLDPALKRVYHRILHRRGRAKAKAAVGRKLCVRLYIMLRDGITYEEFCQRGSQRA
jgi:transposase